MTAQAVNVRLSLLLGYLPRNMQRDERPPYLHTLALLEALNELGYPCELWNALMTGPYKSLVVAGIRTHEEILDWNGHDPHAYPGIYPILKGADITREGMVDIIPGKRDQAVKLFPEVLDQSRAALEHALLGTRTPPAHGEDAIHRL